MNSNDLAVLHAIFNPNEPLLNSDEGGLNVQQEDNGFNDADSGCFPDEIVRREEEAIEQANLGNLERALELLDCIIDENPKYASAFNNRAQIKRLLQRDEDAMMDLGMAIELTHEKGAVAAMALTQRGCLYRFQGRDKDALEDLQKAANQGSLFAKQLLVKMNPYAALCNDMLSSVIQKCREGEQPYC